MNDLLNKKKTCGDDFDKNIRPQKLNEYIGQKKLKKNLQVFIGAAKQRDEALDHILIYGPPGLGKTTIAYVIANEMNANIKTISGPALEKIGDLAASLADIQAGDILFIDEIHRMPKIIQESLYSAMEDFKFTITINKENAPKIITFDLPPFTIIGATTRIGDLSSPLRARFGYIEKIEYYDTEDLTKIILRTARVLKTIINEEAAIEIAKRSRGTPRICNRLFKRTRDFANYEHKNNICKEDVDYFLSSLDIDVIGLDRVDIDYLKILIDRFSGGPVGIRTLSDALGEDERNIEDVYEPYLIQIGFINKTPKGRIATELAYKHLNKQFYK